MTTRNWPIYGAGKIHRSDRMKDGEGTRIARAFLDQTLEHLARRTLEYYELTGEHVFAYGERQIHSVLFPAILDISDAALAELPITRKPWGGTKSSGRVDYWIWFRDTIVLLEVKHAFHAVRTSRLPEWARGFWTQVVHQAKSIRTNEIRDQALRYRKDKLLAIALLIVPTWRSSKRPVKEIPERKESEMLTDHENILDTMGGSDPSWSACWVVPRLKRIETYGSRSHEVHDGVNCFAFVRQIRR